MTINRTIGKRSLPSPLRLAVSFTLDDRFVSAAAGHKLVVMFGSHP
jgi:hypothetical protein